MGSLKKCVVVTGATGGIGSVIAERLASDGWRQHLIDIDAAKLEDLAGNLPEDTTWAESRLENAADCARAIGGAGGRIDALVHMAGIFVAHDLTPESRGIFNETLQHNATNAYDLVTAVLPKMPDGGAFVFASSLGFNRGNVDQVAYTMAKGAVVGLTRALSRRLGDREIRANAVAPGIIKTRMADELIEKRGAEALLSTIPLTRFGTPVDIAGPVSFLLSEDAAYITGQVLNVDGGIVNG